HLLPADHPLLAVAHRLRLEAREVGPRPGLAEQLAPALSPVDDGPQVPLLLLVGAVRVDGGSGEEHAEAGGWAERTGGAQGLADDPRQGPPQAAPPPTLRPG